MSADLCGCGCGERAKPGKRFLVNHYPRVVRREESPKMAECPRCGRKAWVRQDGTLGTHFASDRKVETRLRCPGGGLPPLLRDERRRRVTVTVDVLLPHGWTIPQFKSEAAQLLRAMEDPFVVDVGVEEAS